jgi:adenosylcobinamide-phosphate synthase
MIGGPAVYHGAVEYRPTLGFGHAANAGDVNAALMLVERTVILWLAVLIVLALLSVPFHV